MTQELQKIIVGAVDYVTGIHPKLDLKDPGLWTKIRRAVALEYSGPEQGPIDAAIGVELRKRQEATRMMATPELRKEREDWVPSEVLTNDSMLSGFLQALRAKWHPTDVARLKHSVLSTLRSLGSPAVPGTTTGLVCGRVQSGKTTHYTTLILAALSAGYRRVLVLGGHTNGLRAQCQLRIEGAFRDLAAQGRVHQRPDFVTGNLDNGDLNKRSPINAESPTTQIYVCKKNRTPLEIFLNRVSRSAEPMLIIDDEADWGTQNVDPIPEDEQTRINELVTSIISSNTSSRRAYVAYTATPYANLLVSERDAGSIQPDYIQLIEPGIGYLGNEAIVGLSTTRESDDDSGDRLPVFVDRQRSDPRRGGIQSVKDPEIQRDIAHALRLYVLAAAACRLLQPAGPRAKMLVNESTLNALQSQLKAEVQEHLKMLCDGILQEDARTLSELSQLWSLTYAEPWPKFQAVLQTDQRSPEFVELQPHIFNVANMLLPELGGQATSIRIINNREEAWIAAAREDEQKEAIYVGGLVFSRGVTIEGLTTTLFAAPPNNQDTLLQFSRWLGYRGKSAPLLRVMMTTDNQAAYREMAELDRDLWQHLQRACDFGLSPRDAQVVVPLPGGGVARPTALAKMRLAVQNFDSKLMAPAVWDPGLVFVEARDKWTDAARALIDKAEHYAETERAQLLSADLATLLQYLSEAEHLGATDDQSRFAQLIESLNPSASSIQRMENWLIALPKSRGDADPHADSIELCGYQPKVGQRRVERLGGGVRRPGGGSWSGPDDRSFDFQHRSAHGPGISKAVERIEKSLLKAGIESPWKKPPPSEADLENGSIQNAVEAIMASCAEGDAARAAKRGVWAQWLRRPGEALLVLQTYAVHDDAAWSSSFLLPTFVTPCSTLEARGLVPR